MKHLFSISFWLRVSLFAPSLLLQLRASAADGPVLTITQQGTNAIVAWPAGDNTFGVQSTTNLNLTDWATLPNVAIVGTNYVITNQIGSNPTFYQLISPCGTIAPPTLGPVPSQNLTSTRYVTVTHTVKSSSTVDILSDPNFVVTVVGNGTNVFDASAYVDPSSCVPVPLIFQWQVTYIEVDGTELTPYTVAGITGYVTPRLTINPNSIPAGNAYVDLKVTSIEHIDQFAQQRIFMTIDSTSRVLISYYLSCKATRTLCGRTDPGCLCFIPSVLPTSEATAVVPIGAPPVTSETTADPEPVVNGP